MKTLTIGQEIRILKEIPFLKEIDEGSSRVVFRCSEQLVSDLKLNPEKDWVIKLAVGSGGFKQKMHEVDAYINNDEYYFAEIAAYGHFIEIMEKVDVHEYRDFAESIDEFDDADVVVENYCDNEWKDATEEDKMNLRKIASTIIYLAGIFGNTSDNGQLGLTSDGRWVAFDYGFIADEGCDTQCSGELVDNISDEDILQDYLCKLIGILHEILHVNLELDAIFNRISLTEDVINEEHRY